VKTLGKGGETQREMSIASPREGCCFVTEKTELHECRGREALVRFSLSRFHHIVEEKA